MFIATAIVSVVYALGVAMSAFAKFTKQPKIVEGMQKVHVPEDKLWFLGSAEIAGALGLIVGLFWWPLGVAAAVGLVVYFVLAIGAHVRFKDPNIVPPSVMLVLAIAALVLRILSA